MTIMALRSYETAKRAVDMAEKESDLPKHPMIERVLDVIGAKVAEKRRQR